MILLILFITSYFITINSNNLRIFQFLMLATLWNSLDGYNYTMFDDQLKMTEMISFYSCVICLLFLFLNMNVTVLLLGLLYLLTSNNLIITFICFELININLYLLICSYSSGIKYIITSLILTTFFIFGIVLTYTEGLGWPILIVFLLKLGLLPFHQLTADLYDGIPTKIMMLLQLPLKLGIYLKVIDLDVSLSTLFALAIIIPAISTQYAYTFKRFMSLSSTSYQTLLLMIGTSSYTAANYAICYIVTLGLIMTNNNFGLILLFLSVAGLPPFIGFYYKLYLVTELLDQGLFWLTAAFLFSSLLLTANYLQRSNLEKATTTTIMNSSLMGIVLFWTIY